MCFYLRLSRPVRRRELQQYLRRDVGDVDSLGVQERQSANWGSAVMNPRKSCLWVIGCGQKGGKGAYPVISAPRPA